MEMERDRNPDKLLANLIKDLGNLLNPISSNQDA